MIDIERIINEATKNQDIPKRDTYRLIKNEMLNFRTAKNAGVYDEEAERKLLEGMVSTREKTIRIYKDILKEEEEAMERDKASGKETHSDEAMSRESVIETCKLAIKKEEEEIKYISEFLPKGVTEEDVEAALQKWMSDNGCQDGIPKTRMGEVMKWFKINMPEAKGQMTSDIVKKYLV